MRMNAKELRGYDKFGTTVLDAYRVLTFPSELKKRVIPLMHEKRRLANETNRFVCG